MVVLVVVEVMVMVMLIVVEMMVMLMVVMVMVMVMMVVVVMVMVVVVVEGLAARCDHTARLPLPTASAPAADHATALSQLHCSHGGRRMPEDWLTRPRKV